MRVCVFYSWQGMDTACCDKIIDKALDNAITALNAEKHANAEARSFFLEDIKVWEKNIVDERLRNANEKAIYG